LRSLEKEEQQLKLSKFSSIDSFTTPWANCSKVGLSRRQSRSRPSKNFKRKSSKKH